MKIMIINGPNLNMLGIREPAHYGKESYSDLLNKIQKKNPAGTAIGSCGIFPTR